MTLLRGIAAILPGFALASVVTGFATASVSSLTAPVPTKQVVAATMLGMPLQFEANRGQVDPEVEFLARGGGTHSF